MKRNSQVLPELVFPRIKELAVFALSLGKMRVPKLKSVRIQELGLGCLLICYSYVSSDALREQT